MDTYFSTPEMTTPRMNARWATKKIATGRIIARRAAVWVRVPLPARE
jgi:hypothetical protein